MTGQQQAGVAEGHTRPDGVHLTKHSRRRLDMVVERRMTPAIVAGIVAGFVALVVAAAAGVNAAASSPGARQAPVASSSNGIPMDFSPNTLPIHAQ
jgi:hypothetical protein